MPSRSDTAATGYSPGRSQKTRGRRAALPMSERQLQAYLVARDVLRAVRTASKAQPPMRASQDRNSL